MKTLAVDCDNQSGRSSKRSSSVVSFQAQNEIHSFTTQLCQSCTKVKRTLAAVKFEYQQEISACSDTKLTCGNEEFFKNKKNIMDRSLERIDISLEEVEILLLLAECLELMELDSNVLESQLELLKRENAELKEEIPILEMRLCTLEALRSSTCGERDYQQRSYEAMQVQCTLQSREQPIGIEEEEDDIESDITPRIKQENSLIFQCIRTTRYDAALSLCKEKKFKVANGEESASLLNLKALVLRHRNKLEKAMEALNKVVKIREQLHGAVAVQVAVPLKNLGLLQAKVGQYSEALTSIRRAQKIFEKSCDANHPDIAQQLHRQALILPCTDKTADVESLYKRAMQIYESHQSRYREQVARIQTHLTTYYIARADYKQALAVIKDFLTKYHKEQEALGNAKGKIPLWQFVEAMATHESAANDAENKFPFFGKRFSSLYSDMVLKLILVYTKLGKEKQAEMLCRYHIWTVQTMPSLFANEISIQQVPSSPRAPRKSEVIEPSLLFEKMPSTSSKQMTRSTSIIRRLSRITSKKT